MDGWINGWNGERMDGCFTSIAATCGGRGWCRRHALPPAPKIKHHAHLVRMISDGDGDGDGDDGECHRENRTEEILTSANIFKGFLPFKSTALAIGQDDSDGEGGDDGEGHRENTTEDL